MNVHENVIVDLVPLVRQGSASAESRALVEEFLAANPAFARVAALMPTPDPGLELEALRRTRRRLRRGSWLLALALLFTFLPFSFGVVDEAGLRFFFLDQPAVVLFFALNAALFWVLWGLAHLRPGWRHALRGARTAR